MDGLLVCPPETPRFREFDRRDGVRCCRLAATLAVLTTGFSRAFKLSTAIGHRRAVIADAAQTRILPGACLLTGQMPAKRSTIASSWNGSWDGLRYLPPMPRRRRRARGHIEQLPSGSYRAVVYAGIDPLTHKARYLRETAKTYDAAEVALTKLQRQVDEDRHPKSHVTVGKAIAQWLEVAELEDTTRERYDDLIRLYILPTFGGLPAAKLDAELLERFYARLQRCRTLCSGRPPPATSAAR